MRCRSVRIHIPRSASRTACFWTAAAFVALVLLLSCRSHHDKWQWDTEQRRPLRLSVIVKTGAATAHKRLPPQLQPSEQSHMPRSHRKGTHRHHSLPAGRGLDKTLRVVSAASGGNDTPTATLRHHFVSDHSARIAGVDVVDVLANLSSTYKVQTKFKAYDDLHRQLSSGITPSADDKRYWALDKFKFVPSHALVYEQDTDADFHIAIDDDTYIFWPTLLRWLRDKHIDPSDAHYIGYRRGNMAYGGAGYIVSRAILDATYGSAPSPKAFEERPDVVHAVSQRWCGDCALSDIFGAALGDRLPEGRTTAGGRAFVPSLAEMLLSKDTWHEPVCSIHHLSPHDFVQLQRLEGDASGHPIKACDVVTRLAPAFLQPALNAEQAHDGGIRAQDWIIEDTDFRANYTTCDGRCLDRVGASAAATSWSDEDKCEQACDATKECLAWTLHPSTRDCDIFRGQFFVGRRKPGVISGWHARRLRRDFNTDSCRS